MHYPAFTLNLIFFYLSFHCAHENEQKQPLNEPNFQHIKQRKLTKNIKIDFQPLPFTYSEIEFDYSSIILDEERSGRDRPGRKGEGHGHHPGTRETSTHEEKISASLSDSDPEKFKLFLPKPSKQPSKHIISESNKFVTFAQKQLKSNQFQVECLGSDIRPNSKDNKRTPLISNDNKNRQITDSHTLQKAQKYYEQALQLYPDNINALTNFGKFLECTDRISEADLMFYRALVLSPSNESIKTCRESSYRKIATMHELHFSQLDKQVNWLHEAYKSSSNSKKELDSFFAKKAICHEMFYLQIYHTVAIEGSTLDFNEVKEILKTGRTPSISVDSGTNNAPSKTFTIRELNEIVGAADAFQYANWTVFRHNLVDSFSEKQSSQIKISPRILNLDLVKDLHSRLMQRVDPNIAGRYRSGSMYVSGYQAPEAHQLDMLMLEFGYWLETMEGNVFDSIDVDLDTNQEKISTYHPLRFAAEAHYRLVKIHPFQDGNGRLSRLLMNIILMRAGYPPTLIKLEDRQEYFESLDYDTSFLSFIIKATAETVDTYLKGFNLEVAKGWGTKNTSGQNLSGYLSKISLQNGGAIILPEEQTTVIATDDCEHLDTEEIDADSVEDHFLVKVEDMDIHDEL